ncbi:uncharacterized protein LOC142358532 [Convolutriloba macropyga]|uniref:uncharacterized protein LOC142358532 n=1 Tax=Convolutriloba macropyga TaxID=536237 RepID=UPI003F525103
MAMAGVQPQLRIRKAVSRRTSSRQVPKSPSPGVPATSASSRSSRISSSLKPGGSLPSARTLLESAYTLHDSLKWSVGAMSLTDEDQSRMMELSSLQGPKAWTYGEITFEGVQRLGEILDLPEEGGAFYDLGSGLGRMVLQVHLEWNVDKAVGVELSEWRHSRAERALRELSEIIPLPGRTLELRNENLLTTDLGES